MKKLMLALGLLMAVSLSGTAFAQDGKGTKEKFYNFDDMLIDGEFKTPEGMYENARNKAKFDRLLKLKKSFLPQLQDTALEDALES